MNKIFPSLLSIAFLISCGGDDDNPPPPPVNNAPEIQAQSFNASEAIDDTAIIGKVTATDADDDALTFTISTNSNDLFEITNDGDISLASGQNLDFETASSHTLSIDVTDEEATSNASVTITVIDVNENVAPEFSAQTFTIGENASLQTVVGTLSATDADGDTVTFDWDPNSNVLEFELNSNTGEIRTVSNPQGNLDFETTSQYVVSVIASDGELTTQADITINVTDENDAPEADAQSFTVAEDIDDTVLIGQIVANDQDGDALTFSFDLGNSTLFSISDAGELRLNAGQNLDFETQTSHQLSFFVTDGVASIVVDVTVNVTDVAESAGTVSRFAGNVNRVAGNIDGDALTQAAFSSPSGIARDSQGNIYLINNGFLNIKKIDTNNQVSTLNIGSSMAPLATASGLAVDSNDNLYISDSRNHVIYRFDPNTNTLTDFAGIRGQSGFANGASGTFNRPAGIDFDPNGNLIVADSGNHSIRIVGSTGFINTIANTGGQAGFRDSFTSGSFFNNPVDVAVDTNGKVYVADRGNNLIRSVEKLNTTNWRIRTVAGDTSNLTANFADGDGTSARFNEPAALTIDGNNIIYVADSGNNTVRKITANAEVTTLNASNQAGFTDGGLDVARFNRPSGIAIDASGNLYVGDSGNNQIRFIQFQP